MTRQFIYQKMKEKGKSDYEIYLKTNELLACQTELDQLCNHDELQFQIVHQTEELLMKLFAYTLLDIDEYLQQNQTFRVLTLFKRIHRIQNNLISLIDLLETMSPLEYQEIRLHLGNGSGQTSPGFRLLYQIFPSIWSSFKTHYFDQRDLTIEKIYHSAYDHNDAYSIAESLLEMDALHHRFFKRHIELIFRSIGAESKSLKGRPVEMLKERSESQLFPELWSIRSKMTNEWGQEYGVVRESLEKVST